MSARTFADSIISKLESAIGKDGSAFTEQSASVAMNAVAEAISEYLVENTTVSVAYVGIIDNPPNLPDPVVADTFKIVGSCAPFGPANSFDNWIRQVETNIIRGFTLAPMGTASLTFAQTPFSSPGITITRAILTEAHNVNDKNPQSSIWTLICQSIMDWINTTAMNPTPGPAKRISGPSTGTANIVKITVT